MPIIPNSMYEYIFFGLTYWQLDSFNQKILGFQKHTFFKNDC